jgi:hypothetical protein
LALQADIDASGLQSKSFAGMTDLNQIPCSAWRRETRGTSDASADVGSGDALAAVGVMADKVEAHLRQGKR